MAPTTSKGSAPIATASGSGASGESWDRSCSQAKNRTNARRWCVMWSRIVPAQHRIAGLERVEDRALRGLPLDVELHLAVDVRQCPQMCREYDADHGSVWTSTDSTAGRSRTMGAQLSPASAEAYTCPPVVPKYTPHASSASTAIASRNTLT
jgi:hypothetical protein